MPLPQTDLCFPDWLAAQEVSAWLTAAELALCLSPPSAKRRTDKIAGRITLKCLLLRDFGIDPLAYEIGSDGPAPILRRWPGPADLAVSLSHSGGIGAASWAWAGAEGAVGVDVQQIRPVPAGLAERVLAESERAQGGDILLFWALKEAAIKARRQAWGRALREAVVTLAALPGTATLSMAGEAPLVATYTRQQGCWLARAVPISPT